MAKWSRVVGNRRGRPCFTMLGGDPRKWARGSDRTRQELIMRIAKNLQAYAEGMVDP